MLVPTPMTNQAVYEVTRALTKSFETEQKAGDPGAGPQARLQDA